jgi:ECF transporter S component (folate family)
MKKKSASIRNVYSLTLAAMLVAMSVVIGIFCKTFLNFADGLLRVSFENLPIILGGMIFGPITGGIIGAASDLVSYLLSPQTYPPNLIVTLGATLVGVTSGIVAKYLFKNHGTWQTVAAAGLAHVVGSMIVKPIGLFKFYSWAVLLRIPVYMVIAPLEIILLCFLFKNKSFRGLIEKTEMETQK